MPAPNGAHGRVHQVNVSPGGVPKLPVVEAWVDRSGLAGDRHDDVTEHGGPHRAVCLYALEAIRRVQAEGHPITPGSVGENLTTVGIELATLPVGTRLAVGERLVLEISKPTNPCKTIAANFTDGRFARISIATHPLDTRMYARVLIDGPVRPGDAVRIMPPASDSRALLHQSLDLFEAVEAHEALIGWRGARAAGHDIRILDDGELIAAAAPGLDHPAFNRAYGLRQLPQLVGRFTELYRAADTTGYLVAAEPPWPAAEASATCVVHAAAPRGVAAAAPPPGITIRALARTEIPDPAAAPRAGLDGALADAFSAGRRAVAATYGTTNFVAEADGRAVGSAQLFVRRGVALLGQAFVRPEARGRGIHRALIAARARQAEAEGADHVVAQTAAASASAGNLQALGLKPIWTCHDYRYDPRDQVGPADIADEAVAGRMA